ncbi:hypothetical protein QAD02_013406 [Eretmocerus hayati]|uniref:Uncharacterized protein n=1 Tax=Eretmocerus hayati TaxID=131215 RepID=A0ACC2P222_9HYME|nr:hypothetical protein QAD02_013406 [Eretmocerus hayati]
MSYGRFRPCATSTQLSPMAQQILDPKTVLAASVANKRVHHSTPKKTYSQGSKSDGKKPRARNSLDISYENQLGEANNDMSVLSGDEESIFSDKSNDDAEEKIEEDEQKTSKGSEVPEHEDIIPGTPPKVTDNNTSDKTPSAGNIVVLGGPVNIGGKDLDLSELQRVVHSESSCSPCRITLLLLLGKVNEALQLWSAQSNLQRTPSVMKRKKIVPQNYPRFPASTISAKKFLRM